MANVIVKKGWGSCDDCGSYNWYSVEVPDIGYYSYYDGHLHGGLSIEEMLLQVLQKLGNTVKVVDTDD